MRKLYWFLFTLVVALVISLERVEARSNRKDEYIYSYWGEPIPSAAGLAHRQTYDSRMLGITLSEPADLFVFDHKIYIVDQKVHSLIVLDDQFRVLHELTKFKIHGQDDFTTLNAPSGISVTSDAIYIADKNNNRIVKLNHDFELIDEFGTPEDPTFDEVAFKPLKLDVDSNGRIYVIAENVFEGIIELNHDGTFNRFTGVNRVSVSIIDIIRRQFATEEQLSRMSLFLPTSFLNLTIDKRNFIFATAAASRGGDNQSMIKEINPRGLDVLRKTGYHPPQGDLVFYQSTQYDIPSGPSRLVDITVNDNGMYTVVDGDRGRLFTYDDEGRLLYISADKGQQHGKLQKPVAIAYYGDLLIVLDQGTKSIEIFGPTKFGELINEAVRLQYLGEFEASYEIWQEVAKLNSNYEIAYIGIGKSLLNERKYREAMYYFKLGHDKKYYSKALEGYRKELLDRHFNWIMTGAAIIVVAVIAMPVIAFLKGEKEEFDE